MKVGGHTSHLETKATPLPLRVVVTPKAAFGSDHPCAAFAFKHVYHFWQYKPLRAPFLKWAIGHLPTAFAPLRALKRRSG